MLTAELDYPLPPDRIATAPARPRDAARLLLVRRQSGTIEHFRVRDLPAIPDLLRPGDLMVFNQTRVLPARFEAVRSATGGKVRGLYLATPAAGQWRLMIESRGTLRTGEALQLDADSRLVLREQLGRGEWRAELSSPLDTLALLERIGVTPLPPYIRRERKRRGQPQVEPADIERYNTVYARDPGSVAAPTAGLHFTPELLAALDRAGGRRALLTLHVGLGTFAPVRTERVEDHPIHSEFIEIPAATVAALRGTRARGGRIIPVGTTTVRALESLPQSLEAAAIDGYRAETNLFITPAEPGTESGGPGAGARADTGAHPGAFRFTDLLFTNFHLPRSTLLALVAALPGVGLPHLKQWYQLAVDEGYRFYSYGDAMLLA